MIEMQEIFHRMANLFVSSLFWELRKRFNFFRSHDAKT